MAHPGGGGLGSGVIDLEHIFIPILCVQYFSVITSLLSLDGARHAYLFTLEYHEKPTGLMGNTRYKYFGLCYSGAPGGRGLRGRGA